jgi:hypothetical protein
MPLSHRMKKTGDERIHITGVMVHICLYRGEKRYLVLRTPSDFPSPTLSSQIGVVKFNAILKYSSLLISPFWNCILFVAIATWLLPG